MAEAVRPERRKKPKAKTARLNESQASRLLEQCPDVPAGIPTDSLIDIRESEVDDNESETGAEVGEGERSEIVVAKSETVIAESETEVAESETEVAESETEVDENETEPDAIKSSDTEVRLVDSDVSHPTEESDTHSDRVLPAADHTETPGAPSTPLVHTETPGAPSTSLLHTETPGAPSTSLLHTETPGAPSTSLVHTETPGAPSTSLVHTEQSATPPNHAEPNENESTSLMTSLTDDEHSNQSPYSEKTSLPETETPSAKLDTMTSSVRFSSLKINVDDTTVYPDLGQISQTQDKTFIKDQSHAEPIKTETSVVDQTETESETVCEEEATCPDLESDEAVDWMVDSYCEDHFSASHTWDKVESTSFPAVSREHGELGDHRRPITVPNIPEMGIENSYPEYHHFVETRVNLNFDLFLRPFTGEQLKTLYYNPMLEHQIQYVDYFIQEAHQERHPFYELVLNYHRARNKLTGVTKDIVSLESDIQRHQENVWTFPEKSTKIQGQCADKVNVHATHTYREAEFNQSACSAIDQSLHRLQILVYEDVAQQIYTGLFARLQVESYIYSMFMNCSYLRDIPFNAPVQVLLPTDRPQELTEQVSSLKQCISVLFIFLRKPNQDDEFRKDLELWLSRMVASLLRVSTFEDHMFLLQHVLRSPPGVATWAAGFVQVPAPSVSLTQFDFGGPLLDHAVAVLSSLMLPVRSRSEFLLPMKVTLSLCREMNEVAWTLVDSYGEEDEDPTNSWHFLKENDVVTLLDQIPLDLIYRHVLGVDDHTGQDVYNICRTTENGILKLCAFSTCLIEVLGQGLQTYSLCRYRQLNKRIGRMIRQTIQYATDHWLNFQYFYLNLTNQSRERLQIEYDQLFLRATRQLLSSQKLGSWQYLADLPFTSVSMATMWRLLWLMRHDVTDERTDHVTPDQCMKMLEDKDEISRFEESLTSLPVSEGIYLLTTFTSMARSRLPSDTHFVAAVTTQVFELTYLSPVTRDMYCKVGRDLFSAVASEHPFVLSLLLQLVRDNVARVGSMSLYLFRELPLYLWQPCESDYDVIRHWLMDTDISSAENRLARHVLKHLNWGYNVQGTGPAMDIRVHQRVASFLVEVTMKQINDKNLVYAITEGVKQVTGALRSSPTNEQLLTNWAWDLVFDLRLHSSKQVDATLLHSQEWDNFPALKFESDDLCIALKKALSNNRMFANYLTLVMTNIGHDVSEFCHNGLPLLQGLVTNGHTMACIHVLDNIVPVFYSHPEYLVVNERFQTIVHQLVVTDQSYSKMAKNLLYTDTPPQHVQLLTAMVQHHIKRASEVGEDAVRTVTSFWVQLISKLPKWNLDRNMCHILDRICMSSFTSPAARLATETYFSALYKSYLESQTSLVSSMFSWIASGNTLPSLLERAMPEFPYLMYMVLLAQTKYEDDSRLWPTLLQELVQNGGVLVESAVKKVSHRLKLPLAPIAQKLCIYRWVEQAMETPPACPVAPLLWQQFFLRYLARPSVGAGMSSRGGVGERFFISRANTSLIKSVKYKLEEASRQIVKLTEQQDGEDDEGGTAPADKYRTPPSHAKLLASIYQTFGYWLDEPRLHDAALYLPALPTQYQPDRLALLFDNRKALWLDFVDFDHIRHMSKILVADWTNRMTSQVPKTNQKSVLEELTPEAATSRLLDRLNKRDVIQPPPNLVVIRPPVQDIDTSYLGDRKGILFSLHNDLTIITRYAKAFSGHLSKFTSLNADYILLLPRLHINEQTQKIFKLECTSMYNLRHRCGGPVEMVAKYHAHRPVEVMIRRAQENRGEFKQLLVAALMPPPENVCSAAVHVENTIAALIGCHQNPAANQNARNFQLVGQALFYHLVSLVNMETSLYIPTRQFFSSCIEILGQEFIMPDQTQCEDLLSAILDHPDLSGLLAPNFVPNRSPQRYVHMYTRLCGAISKHGPVLIFMLLSKFDVTQWLTTEPDTQLIRSLYTALADGFRTCSPEPQEQMNLVFGIFRSHFKLLTVHKFPENLFFSLGLLTEGTTNKQISVLVWEDMTSCLGITDQSETSHDLRHLMSIPMLADLSVYLHDYFSRLRVSNTDYRSYGLYHVWSVAVPHYSHLCTWLSDTYVHKLNTSVHSAGLDVNQAIELQWELLTSLFSPWVTPSLTPGHVTCPWMITNNAHARVMVATFTRMLLRFHQSFCVSGVERQKKPLSLVWRYYVTRLAVIGSSSHVTDLIQSELVTLPWQYFSPDMELLETMIKLFDHEDKNVFVFTSKVFSQVTWYRLLQDHVTSGNPDMTSHLIVMLLQLVVRFSTRPEILQDVTMSVIVRHCEELDWSMLKRESYQDITKWFLEYCDPGCVLDERGTNGTLVLGLLKTAAEFSPVTSRRAQPGDGSKHCLYARLVVGLLCRCTHHQKMVAEKLGLILNNLLTEIEAIVPAVEDLTCQDEQASALLCEVLALLNNCNPRSDITLTIVTSYRDWMTSSPESVLLVPSIGAACRTVASVDVLADILYTTCMAIFAGKQEESIATRWERIIQKVNVPELCRDDFIKRCLGEGYYILLYIYTVQQTQRLTRPEDEYTCMCHVVDWLGRIKPSLENEPELLLWLYRLLDMISHQLLDYGVKQSVMVTMVTRLCQNLSSLSEDKASAGLLGAIGLGRKSTLSIRFRLIARSLSTFLLCQTVTNDQLRLTPSSPAAVRDPKRPSKRQMGHTYPNQQSLEALQALESLRANKLYQPIRDHVIFATEFVSNPLHSVKESRILFTRLVRALFDDVTYLKIVR